MIDSATREGRRRPASIEWPTLSVALAIYAGFFLLTWNYHALPWWVILPVGSYLVAWHGSLQHETVHGHPTPWRGINELLVFPSLWLWMPYEHYRTSHLRHHRNQHLTDPLEDPESFYLSQDRWRDTGPLLRRVLAIHNTLSGRLLIGPAVVVWRLCTAGLADLPRARRPAWRTLGVHLLSCALVLTWVVSVCDIPPLAYIALFAYPGTSLTLLRSFAEHRARPNPDERTIVVEAEPALALLYLNNNLHAVHHRDPQAPWYELPRRWRVDRSDVLRDNGNYLVGGYRELFGRYLFCQKEPVRYPLTLSPEPSSAVF